MMFNAGVRPSTYSFFKFNQAASNNSARVYFWCVRVHLFSDMEKKRRNSAYIRCEFVTAGHKNIQPNQADIMFVALWLFCRFASHCKFHQHNANMKATGSKIDDAHKHRGPSWWMRRVVVDTILHYIFNSTSTCVLWNFTCGNNAPRAHA